MLEQTKSLIKTFFYRFIMGECPFCRIVEGETDTQLVFENDQVIVFPPLQKDMLSEGHLLVVPREHFKSIHDIPEDRLADLMAVAKKVSSVLEEKGYPGVNLLHASGREAQQSVDHFHIHLAPRREDDGLDLWPDTGYSNKAEKVYRSLAEKLD